MWKAAEGLLRHCPGTSPLLPQGDPSGGPRLPSVPTLWSLLCCPLPGAREAPALARLSAAHGAQEALQGERLGHAGRPGPGQREAAAAGPCLVCPDNAAHGGTCLHRFCSARIPHWAAVLRPHPAHAQAGPPRPRAPGRPGRLPAERRGRAQGARHSPALAPPPAPGAGGGRQGTGGQLPEPPTPLPERSCRAADPPASLLHLLGARLTALGHWE